MGKNCLRVASGLGVSSEIFSWIEGSPGFVPQLPPRFYLLVTARLTASPKAVWARLMLLYRK